MKKLEKNNNLDRHPAISAQDFKLKRFKIKWTNTNTHTHTDHLENNKRRGKGEKRKKRKKGGGGGGVSKNETRPLITVMKKWK